MNANTTFIALVIFIANPFFTSAQITGRDADAIIPGSETVKLRNYTKVPEFIRFRPGTTITLPELQDFLRNNFFDGNEPGLNFLNSFSDELGYTHYRYQQYYQNIPIEGSAYIAHVKNFTIKTLNGIVYSNPETVNIQKISSGEAREKAIEYVSEKLVPESPSGTVIFKWQIPSEEEHLRSETGNPGATYFPEGKFCWVPKNGDFKSNRLHLSYKFDIYSSEPLYRAYIFVDAATGEIIFERNRIHTADVQGTAVTKYSGTQTITADSYGGSYRLREAGRGNGIRTYDMNTGTNYGSAVDFTDADNFWNNVNANQDEVATDAHWGAEMTYDYFLNIHNRNSIDNNGYNLLSYVHYSSGYSNAFWDGQRMTYGDGSGSYDPFTALDIAGHEISHGLTEMSANLDYSYESGALNESFSDIFGAAIEFYGKPASANWLVGENIGVTLRSMSNPNAYGDPDTYQGTNWYTGAADNGGVHTNSGVQNFWFYLLSQGGNGTNDIGNSYNITGLGITNASKVAFRNLTVYLWNTAEYSDARFYAIQSAIDLFGPCTAEVIATTNAWYAVGVGGQFNPTVTADFSAPATTSCSVPFTANFSNLSTNGGSFTWNFGDGNTSTLVNPSYTYNTYGTFTVALIADGAACGADTVVKTAYIQVDTALPCILIMPVAGTADVQTACSGTVYDNGGPSANYADNNTSLVTISPTGAATVTLTRVSFDIEPGSGPGLCDYDHVEFFDGPNTSSPSLGRYCNNIMPPSTITSTTGSITLRHYADPAVNNAGFQFNWSCTLASAPPVANFTSDVISTCTGAVQFSDLSTNGATSWLWNFGDGGTSTLQNPSYAYASNGSYTVTLTATNSYGSDSEIKTAYITVNKPAPPSVTGASRCGSGAVTLTASGTGNLEWYADTVGGTSTGTGSSFSTPVLSSTTDYYVEDVLVPASQYVGPQDNTFGSGAYYAGNRYLIFHCYSPVTLVSVLVYANGAGNRTIQLRDENGTVIHDTTMYVQDGATRITLNFDVPAADSLQLGIAGTPNLYRNSTNPSYPYTLPGLISIIQSSAAFSSNYTYYYFFYDWEVREPICRSERAKVTAIINPVPSVTATVNSSPACYGYCDGTISAGGSSGTPPYSFTWSNGQTGSAATGLCAGNYSVTVADVNGCSSSGTNSLSQPSAISPAMSAVNATCGNSNGSASVTASNGTPPYSYEWNTGNTQSTITGLAAGNYSVTVTDNTGCTGINSVAVNNDVPIASIQSTAGTTCFGYSDGTAVAGATGGTIPYTYLWDAGTGNQTGSTAAGLPAGNYTVTVTDISGCLSTAVATVTEPTAVTINITTTDAACSASCSGSASAGTGGGNGSYSWLWNTGQTSSSIASLCQGTYSVTATDQSGCTGNSQSTVNSAGGFTASISSLTNSSCTVCDGDATITLSGGVAPFTYLWNDPSQQSAATATGLCAGNFTVTATDAAGCTGTVTASVYSSGGLLSDVTSINDATCNGSSDGAVTVSASGGLPPYSFMWSNGVNGTDSSQFTVDSLQSGFYSVTITDNSSCMASAGVSIGQPAAVTLVMSPSDTICEGNSAIISATATGGNGIYTYLWDQGLPPGQSQTVTPSITTTYTAIAVDGNGCTSNGNLVTIFVEVCSGMSASLNQQTRIEVFPNPVYGGNPVLIRGNGNQVIDIRIINVAGQAIHTIRKDEIVTGGKDLTMELPVLPSGMYQVWVKTSNESRRIKILVLYTDAE
ncbi:MAG: M4 family metallopeptidase [Bacteroidetes bacterium]|nr:M4 family metallopeptidase [Bacteroidota bacterium]